MSGAKEMFSPRWSYINKSEHTILSPWLLLYYSLRRGFRVRKNVRRHCLVRGCFGDSLLGELFRIRITNLDCKTSYIIFTVKWSSRSAFIRHSSSYRLQQFATIEGIIFFLQRLQPLLSFSPISFPGCLLRVIEYIGHWLMESPWV